MKNLLISQAVQQKLLHKHGGITRSDVIECFYNRTNTYLLDPREDHRTDPPTEWFISETDLGRRLKIVFVFEHGNVYLKSAFDPNESEERIYAQNSKQEM